ncbi:MAG: dual specificity protein phosphatase [Anaerolineae bacterium]|jgi:dual specificity phosphatase 12
MQNIGNVHHVADGVYIGGARAVYLVPELRRAGVTRVLKLYFHIPDWPEDFLVCDNPLEDGVFVPQEVLQRGVSFVREQVEAGEKVLVVCGAGISRSSTFVLAYLLERGYELREAWQLLSTRHPIALPLPQMWDSLFTHYDLPYTYRDVVSWRVEKL